MLCDHDAADSGRVAVGCHHVLSRLAAAVSHPESVG